MAGRVRLEQQIWAPLLARNEMGNPSVGYVLDEIRGLADYQGLFESAFAGQALSMETLGAALASYERALISGNSAFDRWHFGKDDTAVSDGVKRGFRLFTDKANWHRLSSNPKATRTVYRFIACTTRVSATSVPWRSNRQPCKYRSLPASI